MDVLADLLNLLRISDIRLFRTRFNDPWAAEIEQKQASVFHGIIHGGCWVKIAESADPIRLSAGDIIVFPTGSAHSVTSLTDPGTSSFNLMDHEDDRVFRDLSYGGKGDEALVLSGSFSFSHPAASSLIPLLPQVIYLNAGEDDQVLSMLALISAELDKMRYGSESVIIRSMQTMFVFLLRHHAATDMVCNGSLMLALKDKRISNALSLMHKSPEDRWTVGKLASKVGMSRSGFFMRFKSLMGDSPANYLGRWRMFTAADIMNQFPALSTVEVAERVGYQSESAFSKAFKQHMGITPGSYRVKLAR